MLANKTKTVASGKSNTTITKTAKKSTMDFGAPCITSELDECLTRELIAKQKIEAAEKEREQAKGSAKKKQAKLGDEHGPAGLCDIINEMEKKLDSA